MQANRCLLLNLHTLAYINGFRVQSFFLTKYIYILYIYIEPILTVNWWWVDLPGWPAGPMPTPIVIWAPHTPRPSRGPTYI
jgi:hypothetical protein